MQPRGSRRWSALLVVAILCVPVSARPCIRRPHGIDRPHARIVDQARQIFLAEVVARRPGLSSHDDVAFIYSLRILRVLKGGLGARAQAPARGILKAGATIELDGEAPSAEATTTFSNHEDPESWKDAAGRLGVAGDCSVGPPNFFEQAKYLVLLGDSDDLLGGQS